MSKTKKNRPGAGTPGRQTETGTYGRASTSIYQNTTQPTGRQPGMIEKLLSSGAENAVPLQHLVKLMDKPARQVRQQIQAERLRGIPILSDNEHGYYLPKTQEDVDNFVRSMLHRAHEIARVANTVRLRGRRLD
ncbi:hypothetical protein B5E56_12810 [Flavonifractor sp. An112]|uniref:hypothetical protein n=1 Tax=Flavonifractor sp. An112 TaxID=1965544 RepID=UPI000B399CFF|nr:hypothetical protein [Flavonifractor sp. An112]OUQ56529.1 hypothetical protein B5E56_12810 [Flavonifractor sp. An112]